MTIKPKIKADDVLYRLLRDGHVVEFNEKKAQGVTTDLTHCDFRGVDLRGLDAMGIDFSDAYFRQADLRGIDFSTSCLKGASINAAKISGTYFPVELTAEEIMLSLLHGTRLRHSK